MIFISVHLKLPQFPPSTSRFIPRPESLCLNGYHTIPSNHPLDGGLAQAGLQLLQSTLHAGQLPSSPLHALHVPSSESITQLVHSKQLVEVTGVAHSALESDPAGQSATNGPLICSSSPPANPFPVALLPFKLANPQSLNHQPFVWVNRKVQVTMCIYLIAFFLA